MIATDEWHDVKFAAMKKIFTMTTVNSDHDDCLSLVGRLDLVSLDLVLGLPLLLLVLRHRHRLAGAFEVATWKIRNVNVELLIKSFALTLIVHHRCHDRVTLISSENDRDDVNTSIGAIHVRLASSAWNCRIRIECTPPSRTDGSKPHGSRWLVTARRRLGVHRTSDCWAPWRLAQRLPHDGTWCRHCRRGGHRDYRKRSSPRSRRTCLRAQRIRLRKSCRNAPASLRQTHLQPLKMNSNNLWWS